MLETLREATDGFFVTPRPLDKLIAVLRTRRRKPPVVVVVQTERGQVTVPQSELRDRLRVR